MEIINTHKRLLRRPKEEIAVLLSTLSTQDDQIWPYEKWPAMKFKNGLRVGSKGGHGPIRYVIDQYRPKESIVFKFINSNNFSGMHKFDILEITETTTELRHTIEANARGIEILRWVLVIRSLHNALIEDAMNKVENRFSKIKKETKWNLWVRMIRFFMKLKK